MPQTLAQLPTTKGTVGARTGHGTAMVVAGAARIVTGIVTGTGTGTEAATVTATATVTVTVTATVTVNTAPAAAMAANGDADTVPTMSESTLERILPNHI